MKENAKQNMVLILVGNKNDRENERQVSKEEGLSYMKKNGIALFFETSAKTGENIEIVFEICVIFSILKKGCLGVSTNWETHFCELSQSTFSKERSQQ